MFTFRITFVVRLEYLEINVGVIVRRFATVGIEDVFML